MTELHSATYPIVNYGYRCLFGIVQDNCTYLSTDPPIYFSLGEAVAAFGLIFVAIQLLTKLNKLTIKIYPWYIRYIAWIFGFLGLTSVLISTFIPQLPSNTFIPPYNTPYLWELIALICFIAAPVLHLFFSYRRKKLFSEDRAERFYHYLLGAVASSKQENIEIVITIVRSNLTDLVHAIKNRESFIDHSYSDYAQNFINIFFSDKSVADYIVEHDIDLLHQFLYLVKKNNLRSNHVGTAVKKLIKRLFENPESYLYKQLDYEGITKYAPLYEFIFKDSFFLDEFNALGLWDEFGLKEEIRYQDDYIKVFLKALEKAIESDGFTNTVPDSNISSAFDSLNDYLRYLIPHKNKISEEIHMNITSQIHLFYGTIFPLLYRNAISAGTVSDYEKMANSNLANHFDKSITAKYAQNLIEYWGHLSRGNDEEQERSEALSVTMNIFPASGGEEIFENIRIAAQDFIWEKIEDNVSLGHYPAITRIYIQKMYWNNDKAPDWHKKEREKLMKYLHDELSPRLMKNEKMADNKTLKETALLPYNMRFDRSTKKYYYHLRDGTEHEF